MKKSIRTIITITGMTILLCCAYWLGTTQADTIAIEKEVEKVIEVVPVGYIKLEECIPLDDIACWYIGEYGYPCFELKDIGNQLDNSDNRSYTDIMKQLKSDND